MFLTNVLPAHLTLREALVLARTRWQIELLFKCWKSQQRLAAWRSAKPWRILTEVYAKLLAVIVQHWLALAGCWHHPDRRLVKAVRAIQAHAAHLAAAFDERPRLCQALAVVARCLGASDRLNKRRTRYGDSVRENRQGQLPERVKHAYEECRPSALV